MKGVISKDQIRYAVEEGVWQQRLGMIQKLFLMGWGSILTFVVLAFATTGPYQFGVLGMILWVILLLGPGAIAWMVWKWPTWQTVSLDMRRGLIFNGFLLSWATYLSFIAFNLAWYPYDTGFLAVISIVGLILGLSFIYIAKCLFREHEGVDELFP